MRLRNTQHSEEDAHGYHHAPHHCTSHSTARWRRLVRPWTLVLKAAGAGRFMQPVLDAWAAGKVDFPKDKVLHRPVETTGKTGHHNSKAAGPSLTQSGHIQIR